MISPNKQHSQLPKSHSKKQWPSFVERFSNVRDLCLELVSVDADQISQITGTPFPNLNRLALRALHGETRYITNQVTADVVNGSRHLQRLSISAANRGELPLSFENMLDLLIQCPLITELKVQTNTTFAVNSMAVQRFINEHPAVVELRLRNYRFACDDVFVQDIRITNVEV